MLFRYQIIMTCRNPNCLSLNTNSSTPGRRNNTIREFEDGTIIIVGCMECKDFVKVLLSGCNHYTSYGTLSVRIELLP